MTVCIAAMYQEPNGHYGIWAIADRQLTEEESGLSSEPEMDKTFPLNRRCMLLGAGDPLDDRALWIETRRAATSQEMEVKEIVRSYQKEYLRARKELAETLYLYPHGLAFDTWALRQHTMKTSLVREIARQLTEPVLDVVSLICGFDPPKKTILRPHIYVVSYFGRIRNYDTPGMAAIGSGADVGSSEFTLAGYIPTWSRAKTLRLVYAAKRRAEAVEGVGGASDLFEITQDDKDQRNGLLEKLETIYETAEREAKEAWQRSDQSILEVLEEHG